MNKISVFNFNQPTFQGKRYVSHWGTKTANDLENYPSGSLAMSSYGQALVTKTEREPNIYEKIEATKDDEIMSLDDAIKEFSTLDKISNNKKIDYILACTFENDKPDVVINKKAIYYTKEILMSDGQIPKLEDAVRTCMNEDTLSFNSKKFDSMFGPNGRVKYTARLKPRPSNIEKNLREAKAIRKMQIIERIGPQLSPEVQAEFKTSDFFKPLQETQADLLADLENIEELPKDLKKSMSKAIGNNNFNLRKVYTDYYSLLNDCKTISDVEELYPELSFPKEKPVYGVDKGVHLLKNRLANENFDRVVIDSLKELYVNLEKYSNIYIKLENSRPTNLPSLKNAGFTFSQPSNEVIKLINNGDKILTKFANTPNLQDDEIKEIAKKQALRKSKIWADYHEMTNKTWLPVRLIKNKRLLPDKSEYSTDKLVNTYLYNLYKTDKDAEYSENPLAKFDKVDYLPREMKNTVNSIYWARYNKADEMNDDVEFIDFASKFDKKALGKSIEHMEEKYTNAFFGMYWNKTRLEALKQELQVANDLIYEKILLKEDIIPKKINNEDVEKIIEDDINIPPTPQIDETKLAKLKYITSQVENRELKERCMSLISNNEYTDLSYFETIYGIINSSISPKDEILDEDKALVLINLHDKYLNQIINEENTQTEEEFIKTELEPYSINGKINYSKVREDAESELKYSRLSDKLIENGEYENLLLIEKVFIGNDKNDFNKANQVIEWYDTIPDTFKKHFITDIKNKSQINSDILLEDLKGIHERISSWNIDNDEIIIMDENKIPQKVVITSNAKKQLWNVAGEDAETFDRLLNKFYAAAKMRTGDKGGQGIKTYVGPKYDVELKILGKGGAYRMFPRPITSEDIQKYDSNDGIGLKYIFDIVDDH